MISDQTYEPRANISNVLVHIAVVFKAKPDMRQQLRPCQPALLYGGVAESSFKEFLNFPHKHAPVLTSFSVLMIGDWPLLVDPLKLYYLFWASI